MRRLIELDLAYADNTPQQQMREERMVGTEPKNRNMPKEETLRIFDALLKGENKEYCIRAKID